MTDQEIQLLTLIRESEAPAALLELAIREIVSRLPQPERPEALRPCPLETACGTTR